MDANKECAEVMKAKSFFLNPQGKNVRSIKFECLQTMYDITKDPTAKNKRLLPEFVEELVKKDPDDYTFNFICDLISCKMEGGRRIQRRFNPDDKLTLPVRTVRNKEPIETTLGRLIFYKIMIEGSGLSNLIPYERINRTLYAKEYRKIEDQVADFLVADKIDTDTFADFINRRDWLGLQLHAVVTVSFTSLTMKTPPNVKKLREDLFTKYDKELSSGDIITANKIENELIDAMLKEIKDDPGYDLYASGARGSVDNHMKNMFLMRGGVSNPNTGQYDIMRTSFTDGLRKEDFTPASNSVVHGAYHKAVGSAESGYLAKQLMSALQTEVIGPDGSDCGTTETLKLVLPGNRLGDFMNRYINDNGTKVFLSQDRIKAYANKEVHLYSPMYCRNLKDGKLCEKCAGRQTSKFPGIDSNKLATTLTNLNMKKFHVTNIRFAKITPENILLATSGKEYFSVRDGNIVTETPIDIIVPDSHYSDNLIEELGPKIRLFGTVVVQVTKPDGKTFMDTLNVPSWHNYNIYTYDTAKVNLPGIGETKCRIFHYDKGYELCTDMIVEDASNAQTYLRQIINGKIPATVPYGKTYGLWERNQEINSVDFGVSSMIKEVVLSCSYRYKNDPTKKFGVAYARRPEMGEYNYEMASFRRICQLASTFSGITFESFDDMVTSATNKARTNATEAYSPLEMLFKL